MLTIYALSSGAGRAGVAVVRVSGPATARAVQRIAGGLPAPRRASLRRLRDRRGDTIDHGLVLWFPGPDSFTGEDCAEFQTHGSRAVVAALFDALAEDGTCRPAEPGEFARRSFVNGRADLIALESVGDLIAAETQAQRCMALRHGESGLRNHVEDWDRRLSHLLAEAEADLDFSDEDDVVVDVSKGHGAAAGLARDMERALDSAARAEGMRDGFLVAILGPPNAGKSSLLNRLAGHEAAIVSDMPGTTRDAIEIRLDLHGVPIRVIDTAGLRDTQEPVEKIGVERARAAAQRADLTIWLSTDRSAPAEIAARLNIASQRDRFGNVPLPEWADLGISIHEPASIDAVLDAIKVRAETDLRVDATIVANDRQRRLIESASRQCALACGQTDAELFAESLRQARLDLARVTGRVSATDILDVVFSRFCIGK